MCGIFGIVFPRGPNPAYLNVYQRLINTLAILSTERGQDSAGIAHIGRHDEGMLYKTATAGYSSVTHSEWNKVVGAMHEDTLVLMGHTRKSTVGAVNTVNAHPHEFPSLFGQLYGVHNGTITNYKALGPVDNPLENDSANLFWGLAQLNHDLKSLRKYFKRVQGTYALLWATAGECYITKSYMGSLYEATIPDFPQEAIIYASTEHIIRAAAALEGVEISSPLSVESHKIIRHSNGRTDTLELYQPAQQYFQPSSFKKCDCCSSYAYMSYVSAHMKLCHNCWANKFQRSSQAVREWQFQLWEESKNYANRA